MVSMDNCSHNGDKLYAAVNAFAKAWTDNGLVEAGFLGYVNDQTKVTFPWSMIDKITPRPDAKVEAMLAEDHIGGLDAVVTSKTPISLPLSMRKNANTWSLKMLFRTVSPHWTKAASSSPTERP